MRNYRNTKLKESFILKIKTNVLAKPAQDYDADNILI
jgi:hypothetical protein